MMMNSILIPLAILTICSADGGSSSSSSSSSGSRDVVITETLKVKQINECGFGNLNNNYAFAMESFQDSLYVATLNAINGLPGMALFFLGQEFETEGTEIWQGTKKDNGKWKWKNVLKHGNGNSNNYGVRKLVTVGDFMYGVTANHIDGFEIWRTIDGKEWEVVMQGGFDDEENTSGRGLLAYGEWLYFGVENRATGAKIYRRRIDSNGDFAQGSDFEEVVSDGIGDRKNFWFSDFVGFQDFMYVGTLNPMGMQLYRTSDGLEYEKIFDGGNGNMLEMAAMKLYVFHDKLYIGTMNFVQGASLYQSVDGDGTVFAPIFTRGYGTWRNAYVWYMDEFNGRLYCGTFKHFGQFDLISSANPGVEDFVFETNNAFGNELQYGIRTMKNFKGKLMIGSATARKNTGTQVYECSVRRASDAAVDPIQIIENNGDDNLLVKSINLDNNDQLFSYDKLIYLLGLSSGLNVCAFILIVFGVVYYMKNHFYVVYDKVEQKDMDEEEV